MRPRALPSGDDRVDAAITWGCGGTPSHAPDWPELVRGLAEGYGWTLEQILDLTVNEVMVLSGIDPVRRLMRRRL